MDVRLTSQEVAPKHTAMVTMLSAVAGFTLALACLTTPTVFSTLWASVHSATDIHNVWSTAPAALRSVTGPRAYASTQQVVHPESVQLLTPAIPNQGPAASRLVNITEAAPVLLLMPITAAAGLLIWFAKSLQRREDQSPLVSMMATTSRRPLNGKKLLVLGGSGYLGQRICRNAVKAGYAVTALSRRGAPPTVDTFLADVEWRKGDATLPNTIPDLVAEGYDGVVHAIGLLFDSQSGLAQYNTIVSGSKSLPDSDGTYDRITRLTGESMVDAVLATAPAGKQLPVVFISAAEAGWPEVPGGKFMDNIVPDFLKRYLAAKRTVEARLTQPNDGKIRPLIYRPSLMWDWGKWDVLPVIPVFWAASAAGVPFIDRPMNVEEIAKAVVAGINDDTVSGAIRFKQMDELAARDKWEF